MPQSLSSEDAHTAAVSCKKLLESYKITDVEVEFRESVFARSAGPKFLKHVYNSGTAAASLRGSLTPTLGLQIAARDTPYAEGTGALYISEGRNSDEIYFLSARHVVSPPDAGNNELYDRTNTCRHRSQALLLGNKAFQTLLRSTMVKIGGCQMMVSCYHHQLNCLKEDDAEERTRIECKLTEEEEKIKDLNKFRDELTKHWREESQRVLGHIAYSPPITVGTGTEKYTEDWALIELDRKKIDWDTFKGDVIDLDTF